MWREPSEADSFKSALEKDPSAAARSAIRRQATIRRPSRQDVRARGTGVLSSIHSRILDEIQRGIAEGPMGVRTPVLNIGISEDGVDLDASQREALGRSTARPSAQRRGEISSRRPRSNREQALTNLLGRPESQNRLPTIRVESPSLTPNFAPAAAYHTNGTPPRPSSDGVRLPPVPLRRTDSRHHGPISSFPSVLLRDYRTGSAPSRLDREAGIDGLGDRQRSPSPDGDRETDAWETLLSTITPDVTLPSTDTSFASNTASAADASRHVTSRHHDALLQSSWTFDTYHPCDISSSDDEDNARNLHRSRTPGLPLSFRRSPGLNSTMSSQPPIPTISFSFLDSSNDSDLQQMQAILDRLARREDIPEDWWAGAGLSRTIGRGLRTGSDVNDHDRTGTD